MGDGVQAAREEEDEEGGDGGGPGGGETVWVVGGEAVVDRGVARYVLRHMRACSSERRRHGVSGVAA
jgi:hypothetical protein